MAHNAPLTGMRRYAAYSKRLPSAPAAATEAGLARAAPAAYCRYVIAAAALAGACLIIVIGGLAWTARVLRIGWLDALALAGKVATPDPCSALDWPELHVRAVVPQDLPGQPALAVILVEWPAHPERTSTLLVDLGASGQRCLPLLAQWCATQASIAPARRADGELELRRRQSLERVGGFLVAEDTTPTPRTTRA